MTHCALDWFGSSDTHVVATGHIYWPIAVPGLDTVLSWPMSRRNESDGMRGCVGSEDHHVKQWARTLLIAYSTFRACISQQMEGNKRGDRGTRKRAVSGHACQAHQVSAASVIYHVAGDAERRPKYEVREAQEHNRRVSNRNNAFHLSEIGGLSNCYDWLGRAHRLCS